MSRRRVAQAAAVPPPSSMFADDEPVLQSHPLIAGVEIPVFGVTGSWLFLATRKPANLHPSEWRAEFGELSGWWNLRVREVAMAMLNPQHPAVIASGAKRRARPAQCNTVIKTVYELRELVRWATEHGLPDDVSAWQDGDTRSFIEHRRQSVRSSTLSSNVTAVRLLHQLGPVLTGGGLARDPWPGKASRQVAGYTQESLSTKNIEPKLWQALVRTAWTYVHVFAPDILKAQARAAELEASGVRSSARFQERAEAYLADPANIIPLHPGHGASGPAGEGEVNWDLLALLLGIARDASPFAVSKARVVQIKAKFLEAVAAGRGHSGGLVPELAQVTRKDGTVGPWHPGLAPRAVCAELVNLRAAAYILVAALSMMRDSEIREIAKDSVVEFYGAPAVASIKRKHDPDLPREHWWIIEPVAEAIAVAEAISRHEYLVFSGEVGTGLAWDGATTDNGFESEIIVKKFVAAVNRNTAFSGLSIPAGRVTPHMFRKTMAMLTSTQPNSEIALGLQLKHVAVRALANRSTGGYMQSDSQWAKVLDTAVDEVRFTRLRELYDDHHTGKMIGFGPGAEKLKASFDAVKSAAAARHGDARVEHDLLRKTRINIRFGKLNHCTFDEANPAGAKCLEEAVLPPGHTGPLIDRCRPGKCPNSVISVEHIRIWTAERDSLSILIAKPGLPLPRKAQLQDQFEEAESVIARTGQ
jgi:hypothetical protein